MKNEIARREIESLDYYLQNHTDDYSEESHTAMMMAIQALSQEPTNEKELNKAYTFGHNRGVKAYYNEQLCTVELPEAVFRYILSLVPTEEAEQEPCRYWQNGKCNGNTEVCEDAISREAALEKMADYVASGYADSAEDFEEYSRIICQLPSVTQKSESETWNGIHGQITAPKGTFKKIYDDAESEE